MTPPLPEIVVTTLDHERLTRLLAAAPPGGIVDLLTAELDRAEVVEPAEIGSDVVTMNSTVVVEDLDRGERRTLTLVYPTQADLTSGRISVLAPVGAALLGLRAGQAIAWPVPGGTRRVRVVSVQWQPEAAGELHL